MTSHPRRIALIGLGEVGQALACDLQRAERVQLSAWDRLFPVEGSEPQRAARARTFVSAASSMAEAVGGCAIVISAVTAGECRAAAAEAAASLTRGAFYLDLNSVSPQTRSEAARTIEVAGGRYVEAAVMSPIAPQRIASPRVARRLSCARVSAAGTVAGLRGHRGVLGPDRRGVRREDVSSVIVKGMEALLAESLLTARRYGVEDVVLASLQDLFPLEDWPRQARYMISRSLQHGRRRAEEMREAARTVAEAGLEPWMSRGSVERQQWAAEHSEALGEKALADMLDLILERVPAAAAGPAPAPARATAVERSAQAARP